MEYQENSFSSPVSNRIVNLLGTEVIDLLIQSSALALYDIDEVPEADRNSITSTHFNGHRINKVIDTPAVSSLCDLKSFFLGLSSYNWDGPVSGCAFEPGFVVIFGDSQDKNLLSIFICFKCGELLFQWEKGAKINRMHFSGFDILLIILHDELKSSKIRLLQTQF
ncbi:hypothetical protein [Emticicia sp. C21]|uniref:hypothetical protein n=1 Tax=Emticicia sp. C21 TaxID=2302915 RepID=UPI000E34D1ED|nr:hypothetical protein [Emticicia sp. C21]RFS14850.1 hypothetical protein D0T08_19535 [Emticicia sp. C21]